MADKLSAAVAKFNLRRAKPVRLFEQAVEQIKTLILDGNLKPGDKLPSEHNLSKMLGVSRASVREALRSLESNGIVEVKSGSGTYITEDAVVLSSMNEAVLRLFRRSNQVVQLLQVRQAMERLSVSLAAKNITPQQVNELESIIQQQQAIVELEASSEHIKTLAQLDANFHKTISLISGNTLVNEILDSLLPAFLDDNVAIFYAEEGFRLVEEHRNILNVLREHDSNLAERFMHDHIERVIKEVETMQNSSES